jgi:hypothetical protein
LRVEWRGALPIQAFFGGGRESEGRDVRQLF